MSRASVMRKVSGRVVTVVLASAAWASCLSTDNIHDPDVTLEDIPLSVERQKIDILFVVDDSGTMRQEQEALASSLPTFVDALAGGSGDDLPDLHLGVASSNVGTEPYTASPNCDGNGDDGLLQMSIDCTLPTDGARFLRDEIDPDTGDRVTNHTGNLAEHFGCMAQLGTDGCGFEQHLESMKRALANQDENVGFVRPEAHLAVVFLADEDDCSAHDRAVFDPAQDSIDSELGELSSFRCFEFGTVCDEADDRALGTKTNCRPDEESPYIAPLADYVAFLDQLKGDRSRITVGVMTGPSEPVVVAMEPEAGRLWTDPTCTVCPDNDTSCTATTALTAAFPAIRFAGLVEHLAGHSRFENICGNAADATQIDFSLQLTNLADFIGEQAVARCLTATVADSDPDSTGTQPVCEARLDSGGATEDLPACDAGMTTTPCFRLIDAETCSGPDSLALVVESGPTPLGPDSAVSLRCATEI